MFSCAQRVLMLEARLCKNYVCRSLFCATVNHQRQAAPGGGITDVFCRSAKRLQRNRAALLPNLDQYEYLKEEVAYRVADRIYDCKTFFDTVVDLGCNFGHMAPHVFKVEMSEEMLRRAKQSPEVPTCRLLADEETVSLRPDSVDLVLSSLSLHWINDLPGLFSRVFQTLRPDGAFIAALFGGDTLFELRCSLQLAEMDLLGGMSSHISPFTKIDDIGSLLNRAGFKMLTVDVDELTVRYPNMLALMQDLQGMGENSASIRGCTHLRRDVMVAANSIYKEMYGQDGDYPATFQVIYFIGWKPGPNMPQPAKRGTATATLKDIEKLTQTLRSGTEKQKT